jgi:hypothetical protein
MVSVKWEVQPNPLLEGTDNGYRQTEYILLSGTVKCCGVLCGSCAER